ncbi:MAG TPA: MerR family DNA-binding transcriptional regulator, partial [Patescibacteria group bacterium]|nr:MerR family DNA-binding transcriptional regulator [Patescibacteria group bacterium]
MKSLPNTSKQTQFLTVQQAADKLKVSSQTLRRWDEGGILIPLRTAGNQRRYTLDQILEFKQNKKKNLVTTVSAPVVFTQASQKTLTESPSKEQNVSFSTEAKSDPSRRVFDEVGLASEEAVSTLNLSNDSRLFPLVQTSTDELKKETSTRTPFNLEERKESNSISLQEQLAPRTIGSQNSYAKKDDLPLKNKVKEELVVSPIKKDKLIHPSSKLIHLASVFTQYNRKRLIVYGSLSMAGSFMILLTIALFLPGNFTHARLDSFFANLFPNPTLGHVSQVKTQASAVLAGESQAQNLVFAVNIPSVFSGVSEFKNLVNLDQGLSVTGLASLSGGLVTNNADINAGIGNLTAANVIYSIKAGQNITITPGQNPVISANVPNSTTLQGQSGDLTLSAGNGISISGLQISNSDTGSSQSIFKNILVNGQDTITAGSNSDSLEFVPGTGIILTTNAGSKQVTISANGGALTQWTTNGTSVYYNTGNVGIGMTSPSSALDVTGNVHLTGNLLLGSQTVSNLTGNGLTLTNGILSLNLASSAIGSSTTSSYSGLEFVGAGNQLSLIQGCSNGQVLTWNST